MYKRQLYPTILTAGSFNPGGTGRTAEEGGTHGQASPELLTPQGQRQAEGMGKTLQRQTQGPGGGSKGHNPGRGHGEGHFYHRQPVTQAGAAQGHRIGQCYSLTITVQRRMNMSELTYTRCGDYYIPDLKLSEQSEAPIGKYGRMRQRYLKEHRPGLSLIRFPNSLNAYIPAAIVQTVF